MGTGTLVPIRFVIAMALVLTGILFALGILHWDAKPYGCFNGKGYYGDWVVTMELGKLELRQKAWGCAPTDRYDPKIYKNTFDLKDLPPAN